MDIMGLEGMDLVSLEWNEVRFDLRAINCSGEVFESTLSNPGQAPIDVKVHWLNLQMIFEEQRQIYSFGELETIGIDRGVIHIEADAGYFSVRAAKVFVQKLAGTQGH